VNVPAVVLVETCEIIKGLLDSPLALAAMQQVCAAYLQAICVMEATHLVGSHSSQLLQVVVAVGCVQGWS
jgi:hypothetical protein